MFRVLVTDDCETSRKLLAAILSADPELRVVGEARDGLEALRLTQELRPDLVTMDIRMPRMDGFDATKEIMITAPTPIVIVSASAEAGDVRDAMRALQAGALTVLSKPEGPGSALFEQTA